MVLAFVLVVGVLHVVAAVLVIIARAHWPMILGFAGLAYTLGLRHAFDADHIVAIDGTTRRLVANGRRASGVGFYFSLGHSTVVLVLALWIAHAMQTGARELPLLRALGGDIGLAASSAFMLLMAVLNTIVFRDALQASRGGDDTTATPRVVGAMTRLFGRVLHLVDREPRMYFVGLLFGLGLDTASEVALLAIAATAGAGHLPMLAILALPIAFAAGMSLVDTAEGLMMVCAYGWAQHRPARRLRYNLVVTAFTALAAATIGALELSHFSWESAGISSTMVGFGIVGTFPIVWVVAALYGRIRRRDE
jgi:high-affinity nickel-transport protein